MAGMYIYVSCIVVLNNINTIKCSKHVLRIKRPPNKQNVPRIFYHFDGIYET